MVRVIQRLPFLPVVAVMFGWAAGTVLLAMPAWQLDALLGDFGPAWLPLMLQPPLSPIGRFLCASLAALAVCATLLLPSLVHRLWRRARQKAIHVPNWPGPAPRTQVSDALPKDKEPDTLPNFLGAAQRQRTTDQADEFLLEHCMKVTNVREQLGPTGPASDVARAPDSIDQSPVLMRQPDPVYICEPAPVRPPAPTLPPRLTDGGTAPTIADLIDRVERGFADRRLQKMPKAAPNWHMSPSSPMARAGGRPH